MRAFIYMIMFVGVGGIDLRLNVPRILLPYNSNGISSNFTLKANKGLYNWTVEHSNIIKLVGEEINSNSILVSAVTEHKKRQLSKVEAYNQDLNIKLKCDVISDVISSISVKTTTRTLYIEDAPEIFEIQAQNMLGDTFSSVEGIKFKWMIKETPPNIIEISNFDNSSYESPLIIHQYETKGLHGYKILLQALNMGKARIWAKILDEPYKGLQSKAVNLYVLEKLMLRPSNVIYLHINSSIYIEIKQIKHEQYFDFSISKHPNYQIEIIQGSDRSCSLDGLRLTGITYGKCVVKIINKNMNVESQDYLPELTVYVVKATSISLKISPGNAWVCETEREYVIEAQLNDDQANPIWPSPDLRLSLNVDQNHIDLVSQLYENGTAFRISPNRVGTTNILVKFESIQLSTWKSHKFEDPIFRLQDIDIYPPIKIAPKRAVIPFDPNTNSSYAVKFTAKGGTGKYTWVTTNTSIATINHLGYATLTATSLGQATVVCADARNPIHIATGMNSDPMVWKTVLVLLPHRIFLHTHYESYVNQTIDVYLKMTGLMPNESTEIPFTDCQKLPISFRLESSDVFQIEKEEVDETSQYPFHAIDESCRRIRLKALKRGTAHLHITYKHKLSNHMIEAVTTLHSYDVVQILNFDSGEETLLTIGSSRTFSVKGGPVSLNMMAGSYFAQVDESQGIAYRKLDKMPLEPENMPLEEDLHHYEITCIRKGSWFVNISFGNHPVKGYESPLITTLDLKIVCDDPASIQLRPMLKAPPKHIDGISLPPCPILLDSFDQVIPHLFTRDLDIEVMVEASNGRLFYNFSSLELVWTLVPSEFGRLMYPKSFNTFLSKGKLISQDGINSAPRHTYKYIQTFVSATKHQPNRKIISDHDLMESYDPKNKTIHIPILFQDDTNDGNINVDTKEIPTSFDDHFEEDRLFDEIFQNEQELSKDIVIGVQSKGYKHNLIEDIKSLITKFTHLAPKQDNECGESINTLLTGSKSFAPISTALRLRLVNSLAITPVSLTLINHPSSVGRVNITQGSGYYYVTSPYRNTFTDATSNSFEDKVVKVEFSEANHLEPSHITVQPFNEGTTKISVYDKCFGPSLEEIQEAPQTITVAVTGIGGLSVNIPQDIEINGHEYASVAVKDVSGHAIMLNSLPNLNIKPVIGNTDIFIISQERDISALSPNNSIKFVQDPYHIWYKLTALNLGSTSIHFEANLWDENFILTETESQIKYASEPREIQIYPPFKLEPPEITLIPGSVFQFKYTGGFPQDYTLHYELLPPTKYLLASNSKYNFHQTPNLLLNEDIHDEDDLNIANITANGIFIPYSFGKIMVKAKMERYSTNSVTLVSKSRECETFALVNVVPLDGISLYAPIHKVVIGNELQITIQGHSQDTILPTLFSYATVIQPQFSVKWTIPIEYSDNCQFAETNDLTMLKNKFTGVVKATKPGTCKMDVKVYVSQFSTRLYGRNMGLPQYISNFVSKFKKSSSFGENLDGREKQQLLYQDSITFEVIEPLTIKLSDSNIEQPRKYCSDCPDPKLTSQLLMTANSVVKIVTNFGHGTENSKIRYSLRDLNGGGLNSIFPHTSSPFKLDQINGLVKTNDVFVTQSAINSFATNLLTASYYDTTQGVNHTAHMLVKVKPVAYITAKCLTTSFYEEGGFLLHSIPVGSTVELIIRAHDNLGNVFDATDLSYHYRLNRYDIADLTLSHTQTNAKTILRLTLHSPGPVVLHVWATTTSSNSQDDCSTISNYNYECVHTHMPNSKIGACRRLSTYFIAHSDYVIYPLMPAHSTQHQTYTTLTPIFIHTPSLSSLPLLIREEPLNVTQGDIVCFHSPIITNRRNTDIWKNEHGNVYIDQTTGIGLAFKSGPERISLAYENDHTTFIYLQVNAIQKILFTRPFNRKHIVKDLPSIDTNIADPYLSDAVLETVFEYPFNLYGNVLDGTLNISPYAIAQGCRTLIKNNTHVYNDIVERLNQFLTCKLNYALRLTTTDETQNLTPGTPDNIYNFIETLFESKVDIDLNTGIYFCSITPNPKQRHLSPNIPSNSQYHQLYKNSAALIVISLTIGLKHEGIPQAVQDKYTNLFATSNFDTIQNIPYYPPFEIETVGSDFNFPGTVYLSAQQMTARIRVKSPSKNILLSLKPEIISPELVAIIHMAPPEPDSSNPFVIVFPIILNTKSPQYLLAEHDFTGEIMIKSILTGQTQNIPVRVKWSAKRYTIIYDDDDDQQISDSLDSSGSSRIDNYQYEEMNRDRKRYVVKQRDARRSKYDLDNIIRRAIQLFSNWFTFIALSLFLALFAWFILYSDFLDACADYLWWGRTAPAPFKKSPRPSPSYYNSYQQRPYSLYSSNVMYPADSSFHNRPNLTPRGRTRQETAVNSDTKLWSVGGSQNDADINRRRSASNIRANNSLITNNRLNASHFQ